MPIRIFEINRPRLWKTLCFEVINVVTFSQQSKHVVQLQIRSENIYLTADTKLSHFRL